MNSENIAGGIRKHENTEVKRFDNLSEVFEACPQQRLEISIGELEKHRVKWIGRRFTDRAELIASAAAVWSEGLELLDAARRQIHNATQPQPKNRRRRARFDEFDGDDVCLDRLRDGAPFWRTTHRETSAGSANITIVISTGGCFDMEAGDFIWRGIAAIVITELLEAAGYRVALVCYNASVEPFTDGSDSFTSIELKRHSDPLDAVTLVNALSGWAFRTVIMGATSISPSGRRVTEGYGRSVTVNPQTFERLHGQPGDVFVADVWNEFDAVELIQTTLENIDAGKTAAA